MAEDIQIDLLNQHPGCASQHGIKPVAQEFPFLLTGYLHDPGPFKFSRGHQLQQQKQADKPINYNVVNEKAAEIHIAEKHKKQNGKIGRETCRERGGTKV